jgi:hypothetical protein
MRHVVSAVLMAALLVSFAVVAAPSTEAADPDPFGCPEGWVTVNPPLNPVLQCLPDEVVTKGNTGRSAPEPPPIGCPEGWLAVDPAINHVLECLPDQIVLRT